MGLITKIASNRPAERAAVVATTASVEPPESPQTDEQPAALPPPIPCPLCDCPAIWISIYDEPSDSASWRCCECDPPPAWSMVRARLMLVEASAISSHPASTLAWWTLRRFDPKKCPLDERQQPGRSHPPVTGELFDFAPMPLQPYRRGPLGTADLLATGRQLVGDNHPPIATKHPPAAILANPAEFCPSCDPLRDGGRRRLLRELRTSTGGLCWDCAMRSRIVAGSDFNELDEI